MDRPKRGRVGNGERRLTVGLDSPAAPPLLLQHDAIWRQHPHDNGGGRRVSDLCSLYYLCGLQCLYLSLSLCARFQFRFEPVATERARRERIDRVGAAGDGKGKTWEKLGRNGITGINRALASGSGREGIVEVEEMQKLMRCLNFVGLESTVY